MILESAIVYDDQVFTGKRHHEIIHRLVFELGYDPPIRGIQGFVDDDGRFINRKDATAEAIKCGQIEKLKWPPLLYSEDLY